MRHIRRRPLHGVATLGTDVPHVSRARLTGCDEWFVGLAQDRAADLIALGTHGLGGARRALLGSVADKVVRLAPCPVLTVRDDAWPRPAGAVG